MSTIHTETLPEDLKILLIARTGRLFDLVSAFFQDQQVLVDHLNLAEVDCFPFLNDLATNSSLEDYYKIVVLFDSPLTCQSQKDFYQQVVSALQQHSVPQIYLASVASKINSTSPLFNDWQEQLRLEDELVSYLYRAQFAKKIILGQDLFFMDDPARFRSSPLGFMTQAIPNGYLLDPQTDLSLQTVDDFFSHISKELVKSSDYNFLIKGGGVLSTEVLLSIKQMYQSFYQKILEILTVEAVGQNRFEKKPDIIEATINSLDLTLLEPLVRDLPQLDLGVSPSLLEGLADGNQLRLKTSSAFFVSRSSFDLDAEPGLNNKSRSFEFVQEVEVVKFGENNAGDEQKSEEKEKFVSETDSIQKKQAQVGGYLNTQSPPELETDEGFQNSPEVNEKTQVAQQAESHTESHSESKTAQATQGSEPKSPDNISESVTKLFSKRRTEHKTKRRSIKALVIDRIRKKSKRKKMIFAGGFLLLVFGIASVIFVATLSVNFNRSQQVLESNAELFAAGKYLELAEIDPGLTKQANFLDKFLDIHLIKQSADLIRINDQLAELGQEVSESLLLSSALFDHLYLSYSAGVLNPEEKADSADFLQQEAKYPHQNIQELLKQKEAKDRLVFEKLSLFYADLDDLPSGTFSDDLEQKLTRLQTQLKESRAKNLVTQQLNQVLPEIIASEHKRVYFLLLQDETELRPTGGFIKALAMMVVEDGRLIDWQVFSANQIDNKVLGRISSPPEVQSFLGEEYFYFRDANWDPDFYSTSQRLSWFIKESLNQPVDGVIAINYNLIKDWLALTGDVSLGSGEDGKTGETINSWNLYNRLELTATEGSEPDQGDFSVALLEAIFKQLTKLGNEEKNQFFNTFYQAFRNQQASLYLADKELGGAVGQLGWSGSLTSPECPTGFGQDCLVDQIYQVEANIGVNKVNPYINQSVAHNIEIKDDQVEHKRQIKFSNRARSNIWPLGSYKFYLRFYVNSDSSLKSVEINGQRVEEDRVLNYIDHNRQVFGVVAEVAVGEDLELVLHYSTPFSVVENSSYFFHDQFQPGLRKRPTVISLQHPLELQTAKISPQADVNNNQIVVTSDVGSGFVVVGFK